MNNNKKFERVPYKKRDYRPNAEKLREVLKNMELHLSKWETGHDNDYFEELRDDVRGLNALLESMSLESVF